MLTLDQRIYLVKCYGIGNVSYQYAIQLFHQKYPDVRITRQAATKLIKKFDRTGDVKDTKRLPRQYNDEEDAATLVILNSVQEAPKLSLRKRSENLRISKSHIQRILVKNNFHPFKPKFVHKLEDGDGDHRLEFCLLMGERIMDHRFFYQNILFSDESTFSTNGVVSTQNCRFWAQNNPNFRIRTRSQRFKKVNVWCGMLYNRIIGPYFLNTLNQNTYLEILENFVMTELEEESLEFRGKLFFQQDGCPAHSTLRVRAWLNEHFPNRWIGRFGPLKWPARSPDLTPLDFFLWGYLKEKVYANELEDDLENLKQKIVEAVASVNEEMLSSTYLEFRRRIEECVLRGGYYVE